MTTTTVMGSTPTDIRAGRNRSGSDIAKFLVVKGDATNAPDAVAVTAADTDIPVGVTMEIIKNGYNGDVCRKGRVPCIASGVIAAEARIAPAANGKIQAALAADIVMGHACEAAAADGDIIMCDIDCVAPTLL